MSRKRDLKQAIAESEKEIQDLEKKRNRSQSALLDCFLSGVRPNQADADYFRIYTQLIDAERRNLRILKEKLARL